MSHNLVPHLHRRPFPVKFDFPLCLAPMVGLSHVHLRRLVRSYTPENVHTLWPTEMLNSRKIPKENLTDVAETRRALHETGLSPQILGNEEEEIRLSVKKLVDWGAESIDINMGCPVKKALSHNYGVALMGDADYASKVVAMTVRHSSVPVSVKLRSGFVDDLEYLKKFTKGLENAGASWITLHPRLAGEVRRGEAKWDQIRFIREELSIPVIGNGDVQTADDVMEMLDGTDCDGVMVGRALTARPWLMWQVGENWGLKRPLGRSGVAPRSMIEEGAEYGKALLQMLAYMAEEPRRDLALRQFRFFVKTGSVWLEFGHSLYALTTKIKSLEEMKEPLQQFFSVPQRMYPRTNLRQ